MKIGIYGGSFNPPHKMHLKMATTLIETGYLDKVIFVPTGNKYPKPGLASNWDRLKMVELMVEKYPNIEVSDYELKQELIYTYQTLDYFKQKYPRDEIYFILGSDLLKEFTTWKNYSYILETFKILVTLRNHDTKQELEKLSLSNQGNLLYTDIMLEDLSSTEIREKVKQNDLEFLEKKLDKKVLNYIQNKNLYKGESICKKK